MAIKQIYPRDRGDDEGVRVIFSTSVGLRTETLTLIARLHFCPREDSLRIIYINEGLKIGKKYE